MKTITVFTPTYNRAYCLHKLYISLCNQTINDFIWLVIDDGSTDNTKSLIEKWIAEEIIEIEYYNKDNGGMHTGYNMAYSLIRTELNVCIDSDDFLTDNAIESIVQFWKKNGSKEYAGIVGLDATVDNKILGKKFPDELYNSTLEDLYYKYHITGDKKLVYRTDVVNEFLRYPEFAGENLVPLGSLYLQIDKKYTLLCLNEILCIVEYMDDGSTKNIFKQYRKSPQGFRHARLINMRFSNYWRVRISNILHYISHCIQLKDYKLLFKNSFPILTFLLLPAGFLLNQYIKLRVKY